MIAGAIIYGVAKGSAILLLDGVVVDKPELGLVAIGICLAVFFVMKWNYDIKTTYSNISYC